MKPRYKVTPEGRMPQMHKWMPDRAHADIAVDAQTPETPCRMSQNLISLPSLTSEVDGIRFLDQ